MRRRDLLAITPLLGFTACSSAPEPKIEKKPPEPVTGLHALYGMYQHARTWSLDLLVISCQSIAITQVKPQPGKVGAWQAVFAAPSLGQKRAYTFSVVDASDSLHEGISADSPTAMGSDSLPFLLAGAKTDTDKAWEIALEHSQGYTTKHPDTPISYALGLSRAVNQPVRRVIFGESIASSAFSILIEASTGEYLQTLQ